MTPSSTLPAIPGSLFLFVWTALPMMTLYPTPFLSSAPADAFRFRPGRLPKHNQRSRDLDFAQITPQQAKAEARRLLASGLSPQTWHTLDLLATGGVLRAENLQVPARTLQRWAQQRLVERLALDSRELQDNLRNLGLDDPHPALYVLGLLGIEIATQRHAVPPPSGYQGYTPGRVLHDVVANEIVLRLAEAIGTQGWKVEWLGKYEATLTDKTQKVLLEPDALLRFRRDGQERACALEYHNEDWQARAAQKVEKYETAFAEGNWRERWEVETFPPVLAVFWQPIVGTGYKNATAGKRLACTYYGKLLKTVLEGKLDEWINVATGAKEALWPE
jgi:hypothetical protein